MSREGERQQKECQDNNRDDKKEQQNRQSMTQRSVLVVRVFAIFQTLLRWKKCKKMALKPKSVIINQGTTNAPKKWVRIKKQNGRKTYC